MHAAPTHGKITVRVCGILRIGFAVTLGAQCAGCTDDSAVVWQKSVKSPDGNSIVVAKTTQYGGLGTAAVYTTVDIARPDGEGKAVEVLVFEVPTEPNPAAIQVEMSWSDVNHLDLAYPKGAKLSFRANLYGDTTITSHPR